ncbi:MAG: hypothetical protein AAF388_19690 [Bacteroidota bacterium]
MREFILLVFIASLAPTPGNFLLSQSEYKLLNYYPGTITLSDSTKLVGKIKELNGVKPFKKVIFISSDGIEKKYKPSMILRYSTQIKTYVSVQGKFMEVIHKGSRVSLLLHGKNKWYSTNFIGPGIPIIPFPTKKTTYYLQREDPRFAKEVKKSMFKVVFSNYFKDCPELATLISEGEYKHKDIRKIVWEYNACKSR